MTHQDRHLNIKVRDVIQIYRIFNNLRDSGEDNFDEIKLYKLKAFPFFDASDYNQIVQIAKRLNQKPKNFRRVKNERSEENKSLTNECNIEPSNRVGGDGECFYSC
eukprot:CAMPEP_0168616004 /NCGR_PEP_ID=MMETSP0449_2-20121227/4800_1 /TAXON_ID=1082188 /ORGANISM="Strombidium rassoulzadegani, Strain ras09" /LENGTH=105 /DNA_ID=CAMNT_0008656769 /DNA_START=547 /DNA_END=864 /DNA_ORIENTATION=+